jgi:hypothetical protein
MRAVRQGRRQERLTQGPEHRRCHATPHRGEAQGPDTPLARREIHPPQRARLVSTRLPVPPQRPEVLLHLGFAPRDSLFVEPCRAPLALHRLHGFATRFERAPPGERVPPACAWTHLEPARAPPCASQPRGWSPPDVGSVLRPHVACPDKVGRPVRRRYPWAHWPPAMRLRPPAIAGVSSWSPHAGSPPPDTLWSPRSERRGTPRPRRRLTPPCGMGRIAGLLPGLLTRDRRGPSSGRCSPHFLPGTPPSPLQVIRGDSPTPRTESGHRPQRFRGVRPLAPRHGRSVVPPDVSQPGHFDAALAGRPWLPPPLGGECEPRLLSGDEPAQGGFGSYEPHRLGAHPLPL